MFGLNWSNILIDAGVIHEGGRKSGQTKMSRKGQEFSIANQSLALITALGLASSSGAPLSWILPRPSNHPWVSEDAEVTV